MVLKTSSGVNLHFYFFYLALGTILHKKRQVLVSWHRFPSIWDIQCVGWPCRLLKGNHWFRKSMIYTPSLRGCTLGHDRRARTFCHGAGRTDRRGVGVTLVRDTIGDKERDRMRQEALKLANYVTTWYSTVHTLWRKLWRMFKSVSKACRNLDQSHDFEQVTVVLPSLLLQKLTKVCMM